MKENGEQGKKIETRKLKYLYTEDHIIFKLSDEDFINLIEE